MINRPKLLKALMEVLHNFSGKYKLLSKDYLKELYKLTDIHQSKFQNLKEDEISRKNIYSKTLKKI